MFAFTGVRPRDPVVLHGAMTRHEYRMGVAAGALDRSKELERDIAQAEEELRLFRQGGHGRHA